MDSKNNTDPDQYVSSSSNSKDVQLSSSSSSVTVPSSVPPSHVITSSLSSSSSSSSTLSSTSSTALLIYQFQHISQLAYWDCGLACVCMILHSSRNPNLYDTLSSSSSSSISSSTTTTVSYILCHSSPSPPSLNDLHKERLNNYSTTKDDDYQSIWTIDIVQLLYTYHIPLIFYTTEMGITENHHHLSFYQSNFSNDCVRIPRLFRTLMDNGVNIRKEQLLLTYIVEKIKQQTAIFIVLMDIRYLQCLTCTQPHFQQVSLDDYAGHYIIVIGYNETKKVLEYLDPASSTARCTMSTEAFEQGRTSIGTDNDVIEIPIKIVVQP